MAFFSCKKVCRAEHAEKNETGGFMMEKLSGIISSSPRLQSGDLQSAQPARPGAPGFGRPMGESTLAARKDLTTAQKAVMIRDHLAAEKKAFRDQKEVQEMADRFFMNKAEEQKAWHAGQAIKAQPLEELVPQEDIPEMSPEEAKYTPKGSYLDKSI